MVVILPESIKYALLGKILTEHTDIAGVIDQVIKKTTVLHGVVPALYAVQPYRKVRWCKACAITRVDRGMTTQETHEHKSQLLAVTCPSLTIEMTNFVSGGQQSQVKG